MPNKTLEQWESQQQVEEKSFEQWEAMQPAEELEPSLVEKAEPSYLADYPEKLSEAPPPLSFVGTAKGEYPLILPEWLFHEPAVDYPDNSVWNFALNFAKNSAKFPPQMADHIMGVLQPFFDKERFLSGETISAEEGEALFRTGLEFASYPFVLAKDLLVGAFGEGLAASVRLGVHGITAGYYKPGSWMEGQLKNLERQAKLSQRSLYAQGIWPGLFAKALGKYPVRKLKKMLEKPETVKMPVEAPSRADRAMIEEAETVKAELREKVKAKEKEPEISPEPPQKPVERRVEKPAEIPEGEKVVEPTPITGEKIGVEGVIGEEVTISLDVPVKGMQSGATGKIVKTYRENAKGEKYLTQMVDIEWTSGRNKGTTSKEIPIDLVEIPKPPTQQQLAKAQIEKMPVDLVKMEFGRGEERPGAPPTAEAPYDVKRGALPLSEKEIYAIQKKVAKGMGVKLRLNKDGIPFVASDSAKRFNYEVKRRLDLLKKRMAKEIAPEAKVEKVKLEDTRNYEDVSIGGKEAGFVSIRRELPGDATIRVEKDPGKYTLFDEFRSRSYVFKKDANARAIRDYAEDMNYKLRQAEDKLLGEYNDAMKPLREGNILQRVWDKVSGRRKEKIVETGEFVEALRTEEGLTKGQIESAAKLEILLEKTRVMLRDHLRSPYKDAEVAKKMIPDNWGLENYLPHLFKGDYKVYHTLPNGKSQIIAIAETADIAVKKAAEIAKRKGYKTEDIFVNIEAFVPEDIGLVLDRGGYYKLHSALQKVFGEEAVDITNYLREAKVYHKPTKRFFGHVKKRRINLEGYEQDLTKLLPFYLRGSLRKIHYDNFRKFAQPKLDKIDPRITGLKKVVEEYVDIVQGKPTPFTMKAEAAYQVFSRKTRLKKVIGDPHPMAVTKAVNGLLGFNARRLLGYRVISAGVNMTQNGNTWALTDTKAMDWATRVRWTSEGRELLNEMAVRFYTPVYAEGRFISKVSTYNPLYPLGMFNAVEGGVNRSIAALAGYEYGRRVAKFGHERGKQHGLDIVRQTQFITSPIDQARIFTNPFLKAWLQFKSFPMKQTELIIEAPSLGRPKWKTRVRLIGVALPIGGAKSLAYIGKLSVFGYGLHWLYRQSEEWIDERYPDGSTEKEVAHKINDVAFHGALAAVGIDISANIQYGLELGDFYDFTAGVTGSLIRDTVILGGKGIDAIRKDEPDVFRKAAIRYAEKLSPAVRDALRSYKAFQKQGDFYEPNRPNKLMFWGDYFDATHKALGFMPIEERAYWADKFNLPKEEKEKKKPSF